MGEKHEHLKSGLIIQVHQGMTRHPGPKPVIGARAGLRCRLKWRLIII